MQLVLWLQLMKQFRSAEIATKAAIPLWVMGVGALGIAVGLALYGPKVSKNCWFRDN